jgi:hypothetical protein
MLELLVALVIIGAVLYLISILPIDGTIKTIIKVICIVFIAIWLIYFFGGMLHGGFTFPRYR